ncbi:MAG: protein kinase, partial [candidate division Zixibacteria bacterium]|nr:protein kinase [candidate division Zixibacteria bacterium]
MIGKTISHYKILEKLGEGGMGVVYKAQDTKLDRIVALKFLPKHLLCDQEAKTRFEHEAKAASSLNHPNITTIHEIDEFEGECFIAMEYVEGNSLKELIEEKTFTIEKVLNIAIQVAEGLNAAHKKGIVHRDIKSDNIMLTAEGLVKIMDFGLAKLRGVSRVTKEGTTLGTLSYMSPEQIHGIEVDQRSDIFSFGVVLYEMITSQLPFKGEHEAAIIYSILNETPEPLARYKANVPEGLQMAVNKALEKNREMRYQHVDDLSADLRRVKTEVEAELTKTLETSKKLMPSIAVLPFTNLSADKEQEYFCDGMAEEIINALTQVEGLRVVARTSAFSFKGKDIDIREIGRKLSVETLLEGSVRKAGNRLRITAQLVNVADGYHLWSERYDREMEDVFAIQEEISLSIVNKLKVNLLKEEKAKLEKRYTDDPEAYNLYLKGRYFWFRRYEGGLQKAVECFQQAIDKDPLYALAYAGIADCYNQFGLWAFLPPKEAYPKAKVACAKALEIDDTLAEAYASLGWTKMFYDWDWAEAEKAYKRAIELNPNYAVAHYYYGLYLAITGHVVEAIAEMEKSVELDPLCLVHNAVLGFVLYLGRRYDEAIEQLHKTLEMDPNFAVTCLFLGLSYMGKERWEEAIASLKKFASLWQGIPFPIGFLGLAYGMSGRDNEALSLLDQLNEISQQRYVSSLYKALIYAGLGKKDQVFEYLDKAYNERESWMVSLKAAPYMDTLRSDPRSKALLGKMGLEK